MARVIRPVHAATFTEMMEQLQEGYVAAVAATAGCAINFMRRDTFGRDALIVRHADDTTPETHLYVQLKNTTTKPAGPDTANFSYQFKSASAARRLATAPPSVAPSVLVVMVSHPDQSLWTQADHQRLQVHHCSYWRSVAPSDVPTGVSAPTVTIDRSQIFDAPGLLAIMDKIARGERL